MVSGQLSEQECARHEVDCEHLEVREHLEGGCLHLAGGCLHLEGGCPRLKGGCPHLEGDCAEHTEHYKKNINDC